MKEKEQWERERERKREGERYKIEEGEIGHEEGR